MEREIQVGLLVVAALVALAMVIRAGYSFRAEYKGAKLEVTPPETPRRSPSELQP
jgi:hypothetical protein